MTQTKQPVKEKTVTVPAPTYTPMFRINYGDILWKFAFWPRDELRASTQKLFQFEARTLREFARTPSGLKAMSRRYLLIAAGLSLLWGIVLLWVQRDGPEVFDYVLGIVFAASVLDKFYFDFVGLAAGVDSISKDMTEARWDLMLVSDVNMGEYVRAKHVVTQIRAWRTMLIVVALRLSTLILVLTYIFIEPLLHPRERFDFNDGVYGISITSFDAFITLLTVFIVLCIGVWVYLFEPRWRLRALAAGGVRSSAFSRDTTTGLMRTAATFLRLWMGQISTLFVLMFASSVISGIGAFLAEALPVMAIVVIAFVVFCGYMIRAIYTLFATRRLTEAYRHLVQLGGRE